MAGRLVVPPASHRAAPGAVDRSSIGVYAATPLQPWVVDVYDNGPARIRGTVTVNNVLAARFVYLLDIRSFRIIRATRSDPTTGAFAFLQLPAGKDYFVVGYDEARQENAVMWDRITTYTPP